MSHQDEEGKDLKEKGNMMFINKEYEKAIEFYTKAIECGENSASAYSNRANCYLILGELGKAKEDCDKGILIDGQWFKGYYRRGCVLYEMGNYPEASTNFRRAYDLALKEEEKLEIQKWINSIKKKMSFISCLTSEPESEEENKQKEEARRIQNQVDWLMSQYIKPSEEDAFRSLASYHGVDRGTLSKESAQDWFKFAEKFGFGDSEDLYFTLQNYLDLTDPQEISSEYAIILRLSGIS